MEKRAITGFAVVLAIIVAISILRFYSWFDFNLPIETKAVMKNIVYYLFLSVAILAVAAAITRDRIIIIMTVLLGLGGFLFAVALLYLLNYLRV